MFAKVEEPDYPVLESRENHVEIREQRPQILAAIAQGSENGAFGTLAGYVLMILDEENASLCAEMR